MSLENVTVRPCDQLDIRLDHACRLHTPWLDLELELTPAARAQLLRWKNEGETALDVCQPVFRELLRYPICYSLPRETVMKARMLDYLHPLPARLLRCIQSWLSSSEDIAASTDRKGQVDALALLTRHRLRRFRRRALRSRTMMAQVQTQAQKYPEDYREFLGNLAAHGLCITQKGVMALGTARQAWSEAADFLQAYHEDEKGHDRLVYSSYKSLAPTKLDEAALASIHDVMELFHYAAANSPLAFLLALDVFECIPYTEGDMGLWDIQDSLHPGAASAGIRHHRGINQSSRHLDIAFELAQRFSWYQTDEAGLAWAIAEAIDQTLLHTFHTLLEGFMNRDEHARILHSETRD
jgi:hypothetical protein